ncbi:MAG TPA: hypothetical protein VEL28_00915 [Candidatus Binatia bacterium]|nr:hypothetical protein [Candidatus Binatia bacterium]
MPARLAHVDPTRRCSFVTRAFAAFAATPFGNFLSRNLLWKIDPVLLLWTLADRVFGPFAAYRAAAARAGRSIPIVRLTPRTGAHKGAA